MSEEQYISSITLKNFKGFKELKDMKIKPVTVLCGTNSCGKSTILQSLLLYKQSLENQDPNKMLTLKGRFTNLGKFEDLIFQKNLDNIITFDFKLQFDKSFPIRFNEKHFQSDCIDYSISLKAFKTKGFLQDFKVIEQNISLSNKENKNIIKIKIASLEEDDTYNIIAYFRDEKIEFTVKPSFDNLFIQYWRRSGNLDVLKTDVFLITSVMMPRTFKHLFDTYTYLGPLRQEPLRGYQYNEIPTEIGTKGENAAYFYYTEKDKPIKNHYFYNNRQKQFIPKEELTLLEAMQEWLELMNIKKFVPELVNGIVYLNLDSVSAHSTRVSIADVGFGVSQIFPILLQGLRMQEGATLLLEQPEIHLHPNIQMQMSDYFIALALSKKRVIAETHSDHVINRLVRRIVEDKTGKLKDLIAIYFIKPTPEGATYEEIQIDDKHGIVNWPNGFFDQVANEQQKIILAGIKKRKNRTSKKAS